MANFIPFKTIVEYSLYNENGIARVFAIKNIIGNLVAFLPLGIYLPTLFKSFRSFKKTVAFIYLAVLAIEVTQLVTALGTFDIDDIILNVLGGALGYALFSIPLVSKLLSEPNEL